MLALAFRFVVGTLWLRIRGLRRVDDGPRRPWPELARGKLAIACGVAVALHLMTFWNMDLAAAAASRRRCGARPGPGAVGGAAESPRSRQCGDHLRTGLRGLSTLRNLGKDSRLRSGLNAHRPLNQADLDAKDPGLRSYLAEAGHHRVCCTRRPASRAVTSNTTTNGPTFTTRLIPEVQTHESARQIVGLGCPRPRRPTEISARRCKTSTPCSPFPNISVRSRLICPARVGFGRARPPRRRFSKCFAGQSVSPDDLAVLQHRREAILSEAAGAIFASRRGSPTHAFCQIGSGEMGLLEFMEGVYRLRHGRCCA